VPLAILTDEHIAPDISYRLVELGYDVICARDRGLLGRQDWELMPWCIAHRRTICTMNRRHFEREHERCRQRGEDHRGVLIVEDWPPDEKFWALRQYLEADPDPTPLMNHIVRLTKASPEFISSRTAGQV
jgi:hypothetical protein